MKSFPARILKADGPFYLGALESLVVPTTDGLLGIQAGHNDMIAAIATGIMTYRSPEGRDREAAISRGMLKVENGEVLILAISIERPEEIDLNRAKREEDAAKEAMLQKESIQQYQLAELRLARTINRLKVKRRDMNN